MSLARISEALCWFALTVLVRLWRWPVVFTPEGVRFFGNDAYYHARRVEYGVERFPEMLHTDPYVAFPDAGEAIWPLLIDRVLATLVWLVHGPGDPAALERFIVWMPPVAGGAAVVLLWAFAQRAFDMRVARLASITLAFLPAHAHYSQLGFVDHHAVVALASVALAWATWRACEPPPALLAAGRTRVAAALGCALALCLAVWPGALVHVVLSELALVLSFACEVDPGRAKERALRLVLSQAIAFALVAPAALGQDWQRWGSFSPLVLSNFQPLLFALCAGGFALGLLAAQRGLGRPARGALLLAYGLAVAWLGWRAPELSRGVLDAWAWLSRAESFQAVVAESSPLLRGNDGGWALGRVAGSLGLLFFAAPLLALGLLVPSEKDRPARFVVAGWLLAMFVLAISQRRFVNALAAPLALAFAWAAFRLFEELRWRRAGAFASAVTVPLCFLLVAPVLPVHAKRVYEIVPWLVGGSYEMRASHQQRHLLQRLGMWLRDNTPETAGYFDASQEPEYGILSAWGDGHVLRYSARRPTVTDNFGDDVGVRGMQSADAYFAATDEARASEILDELRVRYIVVRASGSGVRPLDDADSMLARLYWGDGAGLERHRLIQASVEQLSATPPRPYYRIWEHVKGARTQGEADPGAVVTAKLAVREPSGNVFTYETQTRADQTGRYVLRLPYATGVTGDAVDTATHYEIKAGPEAVAAGLVVSEDAALEGGQSSGAAKTD